MLGKAPPYLSSLVTMATPTRSTRSSRCISLIIPKANTSYGRLLFQYLAAENWKERWPNEELALGVTSEIYLLERVLRVGVVIVTSELR